MKAFILLVFICRLAFIKCVEFETTETSKGIQYQSYVGFQDYYIPFKTRISEPFKEGQTIHAIGKISKDPKRIIFNFHTGSQDEDNIPLHLSIRFDEGLFSGKIVYNTFNNGNWSKNEERISSPYKADEEFDIRVRILNGTFQIFGNRREIGVFKQRLPLEEVNHVSIMGSLEKLNIFHYGGTVFPNPYNAIAKLIPGKRVDISALPTGKRINISLYRAGGEYALQISLRYNEGVIVRNSMNGNVWDTEERSGGFPLSKNEIFDLAIINEEKNKNFQILLNGKKFCTFAHRGSSNDIETLEINGSVNLHTVTINDAIVL